MMVFATSINKPVEAPGKFAPAGAFLSMSSLFLYQGEMRLTDNGIEGTL